MLLELFITLEIFAVISFSIAFFKKSEWFWALTLILCGTLVFASYNIVQNVNIVTNQTMVGQTIIYNNQVGEKVNTDPAYSYLNIGFFLISLILFLSDLFANFAQSRNGDRN